MKKTRPSFVTLMLLTLLSVPAASAQSGDVPFTEGTDFWVTFSVNAYKRSQGTWNNATAALSIAGPQDATITVNNPVIGNTTRINHTAGTKTYYLVETLGNIPSGSASNHGYHITSTQPVTVVAYNYWHDSYDNCMLIPTSALGTEYIVQDNTDAPSDFAPVVEMVATEDNTAVSMALPCPVAGLGSYSVGDTFSTTLNAGQSLMLRSTTTTGFSGMEVNSDKPIALFQGHSCGRVNSTNGGNDVQYEQARPLDLWGNEFIATHTQGRSVPDYVLVTAGADSCTVSVDGSVTVTLQRGQTYTYELSEPTAHITTSQPAYAALYPSSYQRDRSDGDPAAISLNPVERWIDHSYFSLHKCNTNSYDEQYIADNRNYINIVTHTEAIDSMLLDGEPVTGFIGINYTRFSYARVVINPGAHTLRNSQGNFTAHVYGLGKWVCYGFDVGLRTSPSIFDTIDAYDTICQNASYDTLGLVLQPEHTATPGTHTYESDFTGYDGQHHYIIHLTVLPLAHNDVYTNIAYGDTLTFDGTPLTMAGDYDFHFTAANGCDSIVTLHLGYAAVSVTADKNGICPGEAVVITATGTHTFLWQSSPADAELDSQQGQNPITVHPTVTTTYYLTDANGTTLASVTVGVEPPPTVCIESNSEGFDFDNPTLTLRDCSEGRHRTTWLFADGATFAGERIRRSWNRADFFTPPDSVSVTMTTCNRYNCCADTTLTIPMRILSVWFPNVFTPDAESNNRFGCYTNRDVAEFEMTVFHRWGLQLWSTTDISEGWDGRRADGTPCPQGAYVYRYYIKCTSGMVITGKGTVTLLR